jgi:hypothetical protein
MVRNPCIVLTGKEPDKALSAKLKTEAEPHRNDKFYVKGPKPEVRRRRSACGWMVPSSVKDAMTSGPRKGLPSFNDEVWRVRYGVGICTGSPTNRAIVVKVLSTRAELASLTY